MHSRKKTSNYSAMLQFFHYYETLKRSQTNSRIYPLPHVSQHTALYYEKNILQLRLFYSCYGSRCISLHSLLTHPV